VSPKRILIIEDEAILADNLKTYLGRGAADVRIAADADGAMEILKSFTPDLVLLDYSSPGIDGMRAYSTMVRERSTPPQCIVMTSNPTDAIGAGARQHGIRHLLCKPFSFAELQRAVNASAEVDGLV